jgi:hypothetical protein
MPELMRVRRDALRLLSQLGHDAGEVATSLELLGVRGRPKDSLECAMARYLSAVVVSDPCVRSLSVLLNTIQIQRSSGLRRTISISLPEAVRQFVAAFDARCYPNLIDNEDESLVRLEELLTEYS